MYRALIVDDNPSIHQDIRKILADQVTSKQDKAIEEFENVFFSDQTSSQVKGSKAKQRRYRFALDSAYQGQQALELVSQAIGYYALAFMDVRMPPGWDGVRTIHELWKVDKQLQIVVCTAYSDHSWEDIIDELGLSDRLLVLKKPFDSVEVLQAAHALARKWSLEQQVRRRLDQLEADVRARSVELEERNRDLQRQIAAKEEAERMILHVATHDALTGLPNRLLLSDRLQNVLNRAKRKDERVGVAMLDVDHFKSINDVWGHATGDELLKQVARRLEATLRSCDTVARLGGDEFILVLDELGCREDAKLVAERVRQAFSEPFVIDEHEHHVSPSIGISFYPDDSKEIDQLIKAADTAMYHVKRNGRDGYRVYDVWMGSKAKHEATIKDELADTRQPRDEIRRRRIVAKTKAPWLEAAREVCFSQLSLPDTITGSTHERGQRVCHLVGLGLSARRPSFTRRGRLLVLAGP